MRVLVVESNIAVVQVLADFVKICGHVADDTYNGREAIGRLQRDRYEVVITDSEIISVDGVELCRFIKSNFQDVLVIGMSGYLSTLRDFEDAGADLCLAKPFAFSKLKAVLDSMALSPDLAGSPPAF
jgi:DNA-binding response OmpR family regulator